MPSPRISTGEQQNRITTRFGLPSGARSEKAVKISTLRRCVGSQSSESKYSRLAGSSSISPGSMMMSASVSSPSSRTSGFVNAACAGPRRPTTTISSIPEPASASIAWSAVSVMSSSARGRASIRATSAATLPLPITTARLTERSNSRSAKSGWALYQLTNSVAAWDPRRSSPGMPSLRSVAVP